MELCCECPVRKSICYGCKSLCGTGTPDCSVHKWNFKAGLSADVSIFLQHLFSYTYCVFLPLKCWSPVLTLSPCKSVHSYWLPVSINDKHLEVLWSQARVFQLAASTHQFSVRKFLVVTPTHAGDVSLPAQMSSSKESKGTNVLSSTVLLFLWTLHKCPGCTMDILDIHLIWVDQDLGRVDQGFGARWLGARWPWGEMTCYRLESRDLTRVPALTQK